MIIVLFVDGLFFGKWPSLYTWIGIGNSFSLKFETQNLGFKVKDSLAFSASIITAITGITFAVQIEKAICCKKPLPPQEEINLEKQDEDEEKPLQSKA